MIYTTLPVAQLCKNQVIALGRQTENNYRQIIFDVSDFDEPITSLMLVHQRKGDAAPYIVDNVTGTQFAWTITDTDTAYAGYGKGELRINFANGLAKSIVFTTMVVKSITGDTQIPSPLQSWYDAMIEYIDEHSVTIDEVDDAIEDYLDQHPIQAPVQSVNSMTGDVVITAVSLGALTSESDPVFGASAAAGITAADITAWNGKYTKPASGIPATDLTSTVQSRLLKTGGTAGQVLAKVSGTNYDVAWTTVSGGGAVDSVNGQTGAVVLDADDVGALPDTTTAADLGAYVKPSGGIPKSDLASAVQNSLSKADSALQTAPVTSVNTKTGAVTLTANDVGALPSTYTAPVQSVDGKTGAVQIMPTGGTTGQVLTKTASGTAWQTVSGGGAVDSVNGQTGVVVLDAEDVGALPDTTPIPANTSDLINDSGFISAETDPVFGASAAAGIVASDITAWNNKSNFSGSYNDLTDKPTIPAAGVPSGGTTGQVLAKNSNTDYDTEWVNQSGGGGAVDSVNGQTGTVVLTATDVGALPDNTTINDVYWCTYGTTTSAQIESALTAGKIPMVKYGDYVYTYRYKSSTTNHRFICNYGGKEKSIACQSGTWIPNGDLTFLTTSYTAPVTSVNGATGAVVIANATTSAAGLMSATDKSHLDDVYADYSSALTALGVI